MRIGLDVSSALGGESGIRVYVEALLGGLSRVGRGHEFVMSSVFWNEPNRLGELRLPQQNNFSLRHWRIPQRLLLPSDEFLGLRLHERWLARQDLDLFHGLGNMIPPLKRLPSVLTIHHMGGTADSASPWTRFYFDFLTGRSIARADRIITVSSFSKEELLSASNARESKVTPVLEGGPTPEFRPLSQEETQPLPRSKPYLLYVGGLLERKNHATLARAFRLWLMKRPQAEHELVFAGRKGGYYPILADLIAELGLKDRIVILEGLSRRELVRLYQGASLFVFPSLLEGFGFPPLEAMACGAPVIAARSGSIPEVAGPAAEYFEPLDEKGLAELIEGVLQDPERAAELRKKGFARVQEFSWDKTASETLAVYERVLREKT